MGLGAPLRAEGNDGRHARKTESAAPARRQAVSREKSSREKGFFLILVIIKK